MVPEPPSGLTMALLQHHDNANPPQSMLAGTNNTTNNNVPEPLIQPLIEMGFTRSLFLISYILYIHITYPCTLSQI